MERKTIEGYSEYLDMPVTVRTTYGVKFDGVLKEVYVDGGLKIVSNRGVVDIIPGRAILALTATE